jgi:hypothetical protein
MLFATLQRTADLTALHHCAQGLRACEHGVRMTSEQFKKRSSLGIKAWNQRSMATPGAALDRGNYSLGARLRNRSEGPVETLPQRRPFERCHSV